MAPVLDLLVTLDAFSFAATLLVAGFFGYTWSRTRSSDHLLFAAGFTLVALGYLAVSTSQFDLARPADRWDALRLGGHTAGALVLLFAYVAARQRPVAGLAWAVAAFGALLALSYWVLPPFAAFPSLGRFFGVAHGVQLVAYAGCVWFSARGLRQSRAIEQFLVPAAFFSWTLSKYTWLLVDVTGDAAILPFIFFWRFAAIGLLLAALLLPARVPEPAELHRPAADQS